MSHVDCIWQSQAAWGKDTGSELRQLVQIIPIATERPKMMREGFHGPREARGPGFVWCDKKKSQSCLKVTNQHIEGQCSVQGISGRNHEDNIRN